MADEDLEQELEREIAVLEADKVSTRWPLLAERYKQAEKAAELRRKRRAYTGERS